jgi:hypothetical protein
MTSQLNKIKTIYVEKSDFIITVEMWVRTFNVRTFNVRTFNVRTFNVRAFNVITFNVRTLNVRTLNVRTFNVRTLKHQILFWSTPILCMYIQCCKTFCNTDFFTLNKPTNAHTYYQHNFINTMSV